MTGSSSQQSVQELPSWLAEVTAANIADSLDAVGLRSQVMRREVAALEPGTHIYGRAATAQFVPTEEDSDSPYDDAIDFLDALRQGEIAVLATGPDLRTAYWGELFSAAALGRGGRGVVTDGCIRDVAKVRTLSFPAFSNGARPIDFRARMRIVAVRHRVVCGGVPVDSGDLVVADDDGVVVVPAAAEAETLALARARLERETTVLSELLAGESVRSVWEKHHTL